MALVEKAQHAIFWNYDEDVGFASGFASSPGVFWHDNGVHFSVGDVIGFSGDAENGRYTVTSVQFEPGAGEEYFVFFAGAYTPQNGDIVTIYEMLEDSPSDYAVRRESLTAVADAIRAKTGDTDALGLGEMPGKVGEVYDTGLHAMDGEAQSQTELINQIADVLQNKAGTFYDEFWDTYQQNGNRNNYTGAFSGEGWTTEFFKPKYNMSVTDARYMFRKSNISGDLVEILDSLGVTLDFANCTSLIEVFSNAPNITRVGVIDFSHAGNNISNAFAYCGVKTIDKLIVSETQSMTYFPGAATQLENVTIEGVIGTNSPTWMYCTKLTHDSLMSILNALKDYSGSGSTYTVTLGAENLAKLTDAEKAIATRKGWTLA